MLGDGCDAAFQVEEGCEYALAFSFNVEAMAYPEPGVENAIVRIGDGASDAPTFALQLWEFPGDEWQSGGPALWASGEVVGGDRILVPSPEGAWHEVVVHFEASNLGTGFYEVYFDGEPVDARSEVGLIAPGGAQGQIEVGLFREGKRVEGSTEIEIDAVRLGDTLESVLP